MIKLGVRQRINAQIWVFGLMSEIFLGAIQVDDAMGALRAKLEALGVLDNTIILFIMDHGVLGQTSEPSLFETGARISMFARYEGTFFVKRLDEMGW